MFMPDELIKPNTDESSHAPAGGALPWRESVPLAICVGVYLAANLFWQYLSSGSWLAGINLSLSSYQQAVVTPIGDIFFHPLSVLTHPWMIAITGLVLGLIVLAPLIVAVKYRLSVGAAMTILTAIVGHAPVLALAVAFGCMLAVRTRLRNDMPMAAIAIGLLPAGLYLYLFSFATGNASSVLPVQRWVPYMPLVVAIVASLVGATVVLAANRLFKLRLRIITPVLLAMLALPVILFYSRVGAAELEYASIADSMAGGCTIFEPTFTDAWAKSNNYNKLSPDQLRKRVLDDMNARRGYIIARCDSFLERFPQSNKCAEVLWIKAQSQSIQLDEAEFRKGTIRYIESTPLPESRETWTRLARDLNDSPQAALADWRLGELALRSGNRTEARRRLTLAAENLNSIIIRQREMRQEEKTRVFRPMQSIPAASCYEQAQIEANRLLNIANSTQPVTMP
ncbi:MAG: hypothetical protein EHM48_05945 [Planctomycetaceae bacterium]|nr:MAG: hypothetical protein EHM48_05945 [Planctomycetaceae bacterium]